MTKSTAVAVKLHSPLGASKASRWMACPGSVALESRFPDTSSEFAQEGTAAHGVGELCLRDSTKNAIDFLDTVVEKVTITEAMLEPIQQYIDYCRDLARRSTKTWVERKFSLNNIIPERELPRFKDAPLFGTGDFVGYDAATRTLEIVDLKFGSGVPVHVKGNKQLRYYALGVLLELEVESKALGEPFEVDQIVITIVQPRARHEDGPVRSETIEYIDMIGFANELVDAALVALSPGAKRIPGPHCRFCKGEAVCVERASEALSVAQTEFATLQDHTPPAPETLPMDVFTDMLKHIGKLEQWCKAMKGHAAGLLARGEAVAGWKLVEKRAQRKWADEDAVVKALAPAGDDIYAPRELRSPAQMEKLLGKKNVPETLWKKESSGVTMAPAHDPRPEYVAQPGSEFAAIDSGDE